MILGFLNTEVFFALFPSFLFLLVLGLIPECHELDKSYTTELILPSSWIFELPITFSNLCISRYDYSEETKPSSIYYGEEFFKTFY